jgi:hypothetical protein
MFRIGVMERHLEWHKESRGQYFVRYGAYRFTIESIDGDDKKWVVYFSFGEPRVGDIYMCDMWKDTLEDAVAAVNRFIDVLPEPVVPREKQENRFIKLLRWRVL